MRSLVSSAAAIFEIVPLLHAQHVTFTNPPALSKPNGYSHVAVVDRGKLVLIAGQVGIDKDGKAPTDFTAQAKQAFANLVTALAAAGAKPSDLVRINYLVVGLNHNKLVSLREIRDRVINTDHPPVSTLAGVQAFFREDIQIEIEAEAVIP